jgi:hypothetical protein
MQDLARNVDHHQALMQASAAAIGRRAHDEQMQQLLDRLDNRTQLLENLHSAVQHQQAQARIAARREERRRKQQQGTPLDSDTWRSPEPRGDAQDDDDDSDFTADPLRALHKRLLRNQQRMEQLLRLYRQHAAEASGAEKRRLPTVTKTLDPPGSGLAVLAGYRQAKRETTLCRWAAAERWRQNCIEADLDT